MNKLKKHIVMPTNTQEAVISNEALVSNLESKLDLVTPEARNIIEEAISCIKNIGKHISEFLKRGTTLTIEPAPELVISEASIRRSLEKVIKRERDRGNKLKVLIENNIWRWRALKGRTMPAIEKQFSATIHRFTQKVAHEIICEEVDNLSAQKAWNISEAWNIIIAAILAGEVDTNATGISVYFTVQVQDEDFICRFRAYRGDSGLLVVDVCEVGQGCGWVAGGGVVLSE